MRLSIPAQTKNGYLTGLNWQVLDAMGASFLGHEQIPRIIAEGGQFYAKYKNGTDINMGVCRNIDEEKNAASRIYSLAAGVATSQQFAGLTCLVLLQDTTTQEDVGLAVGLVRGNVIIDTSFEMDDVNTVYEEFVFLCSKSNRSYVIAGDVAPFGTEIEAKHRISFDALIKDKTSQKVKLEPLRDERVATVIIVVVFGVMAVYGVMQTWEWFNNKKQAIRDAVNQQMNSPDYLYGEAVRGLLATPVVMPAVTGAALAKEVGAFPLQLGGWRLSSMTCEALACEAEWKSIGGTYESFKKLSNPAWGALNFAGKGKDALGDLETLKHTFSLGLHKSPLPPPSEWPKADAYAYEQGIEWQKLKDYNWQASLGEVTQQGVPASISATAVASHPLGVHAMAWSVNKQDWQTGRHVLPLFKKHVTLTKFALFFNEKDNKLEFSASGNAYVQK